MDTLTIIYFVYMFISLYILSFFIVSFIRIRKELYETPKITKEYGVSILIPAYNEEKAIEETIRAASNLDYKNIKEIIVIDDGSTDNTLEIANSLKKDIPLLEIIHKKNGGKAEALNLGIKKAKGELIAIVDSDSFPRKNALQKTVGYFDNENVGVVTVPILVRNRHNLLSRLQAIEYSVIAFTRKLLEPVDGIYVTPGPFAVYRRKTLREVGGFDTKNITEDIEITWNLASKDFSRKMNMTTSVSTISPDKFRPWWHQRNRWTLGGLQTAYKYRKFLFRKNILGYFILPFFILGFIMGLLGMGILGVLTLSNLFKQYIFIKFSFLADTALITQTDVMNITPTVLNYFGIILFVFMFLFTLFVLAIIEKELFKGKRFLDLLIYLVFYLLLSPLVLLTATFKLIKRDLSW
jgi:cellulose synthase/poly-beta-1,6-N-acetylglucosamine synthase-like glycosyltransferase